MNKNRNNRKHSNTKINSDKLEELDITADELNRFQKAFRTDEFKQLFRNYYDEINDPNNIEKYQKEYIQFEAERGFKCTFINPKPGYVIKSSINGEQIAWVNIAENDLIEKPQSTRNVNVNGCGGGNNKTGKQVGLNWKIPHILAQPPREYIDNDNQEEEEEDDQHQHQEKGSTSICIIVYDVIFHSDALHLAKRNDNFRDLLTKTACETIEKSHNVTFDLTNLKYPKLLPSSYKGRPSASIIRKRIDNYHHDHDDDGEKEHGSNHQDKTIFDIVCPLTDIKKNIDNPPIIIDHRSSFSTSNNGNGNGNNTTQSPPKEEYTTPKYQIKYRHNIDYHECTNELDSKMNVTIPTELLIQINLPLLKTIQNHCTLDVTEKCIYFKSDFTYGKYQLYIDLPCECLPLNGSAKFDVDTRQLTIQLPVNKEKKSINILQIYNEDADNAQQYTTVQKNNIENNEDVDSNEDSSNDPNSKQLNDCNNKSSPLIIEVIDSNQNEIPDDHDDDHDKITDHTQDSPLLRKSTFFNQTECYNLPSFTCDFIESNSLAFTFNVKNTDEKSIEINKIAWNMNDEQDTTVYQIELKFISIGSGFCPQLYGFCIKLPINADQINNVEVESWDNNCILIIEMTSTTTSTIPFTEYQAGLDEMHLLTYKLNNIVTENANHPAATISDQTEQNIIENVIEESQLNVASDHQSNMDVVNVQKSNNQINSNDLNKKSTTINRKRNKKMRSLSESNCDDYSNEMMILNNQNNLSKKDGKLKKEFITNNNNNNNNKNNIQNNINQNNNMNMNENDRSDADENDMADDDDDDHQHRRFPNNANENNDKKKITYTKIRCISESSDDQMQTGGTPIITSSSASSSHKPFKGILKRTVSTSSSYNRSVSESSFDDSMYYGGGGGGQQQSSLTLTDYGIGSIERGSECIPEEECNNNNNNNNNNNPEDGMSESCKKTVRFNMAIQKQLYRINSTIVGQRKPLAAKRKNKRLAKQRRYSEGEASDYEAAATVPKENTGKKNEKSIIHHNNNNNNNNNQHDSGVDCSAGNGVSGGGGGGGGSGDHHHHHHHDSDGYYDGQNVKIGRYNQNQKSKKGTMVMKGEMKCTIKNNNSNNNNNKKPSNGNNGGKSNSKVNEDRLVDGLDIEFKNGMIFDIEI